MAGYCSICTGGFRGGYGEHAGTARHRTNVVRGEKSRGNRSVPRVAQQRREHAGKSRRVSVDAYLKAVTARVRKYRRSRPNDGTKRVVTVTPHYRRKPGPKYRHYRLHKVSGVWFVFGFDAEGHNKSMRRATRREAAHATEGASL